MKHKLSISLLAAMAVLLCALGVKAALGAQGGILGNGPDPVPACKKGSKVCGGGSFHVANGPDPMPCPPKPHKCG